MSERGEGGGGGDRSCGVLSSSPGMADMDVVPVACLPLVQPQPGFVCGTLPVPTDGGSYADLARNKAPPVTVVRDRESIPRYKFLPTETDLNDAPPSLLDREGSTSSLDPAREADDWSSGGYLKHPLARNGEALAVSGLARYGDEVDVIAPAEILKQIFKTPYSKARVSVAVHRVGRTLILNSGPDVGANDKAARHKRGQARAAERALFSNFINHSVYTASTSTTGPAQESRSSFHGSNCAESIPDFLDREGHQKTRLNGCETAAMQPQQDGNRSEVPDPICNLGELHSHAAREVQRGEARGGASRYGDTEGQIERQCGEEVVMNAGQRDLASVSTINGAEGTLMGSNPSEKHCPSAACHFRVGGADSSSPEGYCSHGYVREIGSSRDRVTLGGGKWPGKKKSVDRGMGRNGRRKGSLGHARIGKGGPQIVGAVVDDCKGAKGGECEEDDDKADDETGAGVGGRKGERGDPRLDGFSRVLFWQFQDLRLLLGSDLLLFSNEQHAAVSLHLLELEHQVTPITWLDAWLDNVMASVPELAVCYHRKGVVQGYELLKTDDILLLKGLTGDGTVSLHPHVVQKNASSVLQFLQENCTRDPGTYWLFKNAGEDLMQLYDLSVISTRGSPQSSTGALSECLEDFNCEKRKKNRYSLPLAMLCYRLAKRLSLSKDPLDKRKCANLFAKCLELIDEEEHPCVRATAHEEAARLMLACCSEASMERQRSSREETSQPNMHATPPQLPPPLPAPDCVVILGQRGQGLRAQGGRMKSQVVPRAVKVLPSSSGHSTSIAVGLPYAKGKLKQTSLIDDDAKGNLEEASQGGNENAHVGLQLPLPNKCWGESDADLPAEQSVNKVVPGNSSFLVDVKPVSRLVDWDSLANSDLQELNAMKEESQVCGAMRESCHAIIPSSGRHLWSAGVVSNLSGKRRCEQQDEDSQNEDLATHVSWSQAHYMSKWLSVPSDAVSAHLAAIHHLSQAIKVLRWQRQVVEERRKAKGGWEVDGGHMVKEVAARHSKQSESLALCLCGESECAPSACSKETAQKMERKVLQLIRLLGESYLALAQAYQSDGQLGRALRAAELAGLVCGPLQEMDKHPSCLQAWVRGKRGAGNLYRGMRLPSKGAEKKDSGSVTNCALALRLSSSVSKGKGVVVGKEGQAGESTGESHSFWKGQFWGSLWAFVGDIYVEVQQTMSEGDLPWHQDGSKSDELTIEDEVVKEVKRLKKKSGPPGSGCSSCSLTGCSCLSDRASSGRNASVSGSTGNREGSVVGILRRHLRRRHAEKGRSREEFDEEEEEEEDDDVHMEKLTSKQGKSEHTRVCTDADEMIQKTDETSEKMQGQEQEGDGERVIVGDQQDQAKTCKGGDACFGRMVTLDWRVNLTAADECYAAAVMAVSELPECREEWELALRKRGWTCNELGRRWLVAGERELAEKAFENAINAFRAVGDLTNEVLVHCNLGHGRRAAAEKAVSELQEAGNQKEHEDAKVRETCRGEEQMNNSVQMEEKRKQASATHTAHVTTLYGEALGHYCAARKALLLVGDGVERSFGGVWNEVHTQMAHTYLRLGMFLAEESRLWGCAARGKKGDASEQAASFGGDQGRMGAVGSKREEQWDFKRQPEGLSPKEAITKAILLYESLGNSRTQEAAYAYYQLACHHRDCCMAAIPLWPQTKGCERAYRGCIAGGKVQEVPSCGPKFSGNSRKDGEEGSTGSWQLARRYAALAEVHWLKALKVYRPHLHPDMFVTILVDRSAVCLACASPTYPNEMLDAALAHLLEAKHAFRFAAPHSEIGKREVGATRQDSGPAFREGEAEAKYASQETMGKLHLQLLTVLRQMLATAISASNKMISPTPSRSPLPQSSGAIGDNAHIGMADVMRGRGVVSTAARATVDSTRWEKDCRRLREMYRRALKLGNAIDLGDLHRIWTSSEPWGLQEV